MNQIIRYDSQYNEYCNAYAMLRMYRACMQGVETSPRGQLIRNLRNAHLVFDSKRSMLTSFIDRKLNLKYCKKEWLWYLGANPSDSSIEAHATMWKKLKQADGTYYSNYGQYMFGPMGDGDHCQFDYVIECLLADRDTRRASMVLLRPDHLYIENTDLVCTYAINFCIEGDALHMTVNMRSNDVVFGFTNDAFCFWQLHKFVHQVYNEQAQTPVGLGTYTHIANSLHVYERHFDMLSYILGRGIGGFEYTPIPDMEPGEARQLVTDRGLVASGRYGRWLLSES